MGSTEDPPPPREALAEVRVRAPTRGNRRLQAEHEQRLLPVFRI